MYSFLEEARIAPVKRLTTGESPAPCTKRSLQLKAGLVPNRPVREANAYEFICFSLIKNRLINDLKLKKLK